MPRNADAEISRKYEGMRNLEIAWNAERGTIIMFTLTVWVRIHILAEIYAKSQNICTNDFHILYYDSFLKLISYVF